MEKMKKLQDLRLKKSKDTRELIILKGGRDLKVEVIEY